MSRPGRLAPPYKRGIYAPPDELRFRTIPANVGHDSDPFGAHLAELTRRNAEAIYRAAVGKDLDADTTISAGHKHDDADHGILWHQLGSWSFAEDSDAGGREGKLITATALTDVALIPVTFPAWSPPVYVRVRVSNPAPTYATYTTLHLFGQILSLTGTTRQFKPPLEINIQSTAAKVYSDAWITFGPYGYITSGYLQLQAAIDTAGDKAMLWELQIGYL